MSALLRRFYGETDSTNEEIIKIGKSFNSPHPMSRSGTDHISSEQNDETAKEISLILQQLSTIRNVCMSRYPGRYHI